VDKVCIMFVRKRYYLVILHITKYVTVFSWKFMSLTTSWTIDIIYTLYFRLYLRYFLINFFTARSSYASAVLGIVILSVRPSVCHTRALWQNERTDCQYFDNTLKGNHFSFLLPTEVVGRYPLPQKFALKLIHHTFEKRRHWHISDYNVWTARASEKCSLIENRKSTTPFPTSYRWSAYVTPNSPEGWLKISNLSFLWIKFKFNRIKPATKFLCVKTSSGRVVVEPFPCPMWIDVGVNITLQPNILAPNWPTPSTKADFVVLVPQP